MPDLIKGFKGLAQDGGLLVYVARFAQRMPKRPVQENRTRRFDLFRIFTYDGDADRRDPNCFNAALNQSNGLIADTSGRGEQHGVNLVPFEHSGHPRRCIGREHIDVGPFDMAHKTEMPLSQRADATGRLHLFESSKRKNDVEIPLGVRVIVVVVGDGIVVLYGGGIENTKSRIAVAIRHVELRLAAVVHAGRGHDGDLGLIQRLGPFRPWDLFRLQGIKKGRQPFGQVRPFGGQAGQALMHDP